MNELEQGLFALGAELELPAERDLAAAVIARLEVRPRRPFPWRRVALAVAVLAVAVAAAFAVPQARTTILRWFHLRGVTVERVETLPPAVERSQAGGFGRPHSLSEAERIVGFELALPRFSGGQPRRVFVLDRALATVVVQAYGQPVLLSEYHWPDFESLRKAVDGATEVSEVRVDGERGLWIEGPVHTLTYVNGRGSFYERRTIRIHGNVLVWVHGGLTLRLEGKLTRPQALRLARSIG